MSVGGDKVITAEAKAVGGKFTDQFGNTIYVTDSKENQERLAKLKEDKSTDADSYECSKCQRVLRSKGGRTRHEKKCEG